MTPLPRRKPKPSSTISRMPVASPGCPFCILRLRRRQRDDVEQLQDEVGVLELLGALDPLLGGPARAAPRSASPGGRPGSAPSAHRPRAGTARRRSTSTRRSRSCCGGAGCSHRALAPGGGGRRRRGGGAGGDAAAGVVSRRSWSTRLPSVVMEGLTSVDGGCPAAVDPRSGGWRQERQLDRVDHGDHGRGVGGRRARGTRGRSTGQTLRVPARVVMLGPPYPLISPMSFARI